MSALSMPDDAIVGGGQRCIILDRRPVEGGHFPGGARRLHHGVGQPNRLLTGGLDRRQVVRDVDERGALADDLFDSTDALLLEVGIAHRQHLVDQQDVGLQEGGDGEAQPHLHAEGEELDLAVDGVLQPGELDDLVEPLDGSSCGACRARSP